MSYNFRNFTLSAGSHDSPKDGLCVMEAVALLAGEPHSDHPQCADPTITELAIWLNDSATDQLRNELLLDMPRRINRDCFQFVIMAAIILGYFGLLALLGWLISLIEVLT